MPFFQRASGQDWCMEEAPAGQWRGWKPGLGVVRSVGGLQGGEIGWGSWQGGAGFGLTSLSP